jgi:hypothetical protein
VVLLQLTIARTRRVERGGRVCVQLLLQVKLGLQGRELRPEGSDLGLGDGGGLRDVGGDGDGLRGV